MTGDNRTNEVGDMAFVYWPKVEHIRRISLLKEGRPFLMEADGDYPQGVNWYLDGRCNGKIDPQNLGKPPTVSREPLHNTVRRIAYSLANLLTWGETEEAHPTLGVLKWHQMKHWHIADLYLDALNRGYWTQRYWEHGVAVPLDPEGTITFRFTEAISCFRWLAQEGLIDRFEEPTTTFHIASAAHASNFSLASIAAPGDDEEPKKQHFRRNRTKPMDGILPSMEQLLDWFSLFGSETNRRALIHNFNLGLRIEEGQENNLLPGAMHARDMRHIRRHVQHPKWTDEPRVLRYSLSDDDMIGVLPDRKAAFSEDVLSMRIIGKGRKVRLVHMTGGCAQAVWQYFDGPRREILKRNGISPAQAPAQLFLNIHGAPLKAGALSKAITRANDDSKSTVKITAHGLRHLFACFFLKNAIEAHAAREGLAVTQLTYEQIEKIAEMPARTLQRHLGHEFFEDTAGYIRLLIDWWLSPQYFTMWNQFLDANIA